MIKHQQAHIIRVGVFLAVMLAAALAAGLAMPSQPVLADPVHKTPTETSTSTATATDTPNIDATLTASYLGTVYPYTLTAMYWQTASGTETQSLYQTMTAFALTPTATFTETPLYTYTPTVTRTPTATRTPTMTHTPTTEVTWTPFPSQTPFPTTGPTFTPSVPTAPLQLRPLNGSTVIGCCLFEVAWKAASLDSFYFHVQVATNKSFNRNTIVHDNPNATTGDYVYITSEDRYFWRVRTTNIFGLTSEWSEVWSFNVVIP